MSVRNQSFRRANHTSDQAGDVVAKIRHLGQVLLPGEAEEPILDKTVRRSVFEWLGEINARDTLTEVGLKPRSTCLLSGPPGCGKTTLAHHLSARLGLPMLNIGSEHLISSGFGDSEKAVARMFDTLSDLETSIVLFIDEIDSIGGKRLDTSGDRGGAASARNSTLNVLLRKVESFEGILVAATNRPDTLDQALWRRFGMQIEIGIPDFDARWAILKRYGQPYEFTDSFLDDLAGLTEEAAPSLLRQLMEGVKRTLVLDERRGIESANLSEVVRSIITQTKPHPDYQIPPLWKGGKAFTHLDAAAEGQPWPPKRTPPSEKEAA